MSEEQKPAEATFEIKTIYLKDASFESPNAPAVFTDGEWKPEMNVQMNGSHKVLGQDHYEVMLTITVTVKQNEKTAFLIEVQQAGLFAIKGYAEEALGGILGAYCLETLFPFARETVSSMVVKGGFPQLLLNPVNFNALYMQQVEAQAQKASPEQQAPTQH